MDYRLRFIPVIDIVTWKGFVLNGSHFVLQFHNHVPRFHIDNVLEAKLLKLSCKRQGRGLVAKARIDPDNAGQFTIAIGLVKVGRTGSHIERNVMAVVGWNRVGRFPKDEGLIGSTKSLSALLLLGTTLTVASKTES
jgi:hypothetical protein